MSKTAAWGSGLRGPGKAEGFGVEGVEHLVIADAHRLGVPRASVSSLLTTESPVEWAIAKIEAQEQLAAGKLKYRFKKYQVIEINGSFT